MSDGNSSRMQESPSHMSTTCLVYVLLLPMSTVIADLVLWYRETGRWGTPQLITHFVCRNIGDSQKTPLTNEVTDSQAIDSNSCKMLAMLRLLVLALTRS